MDDALWTTTIKTVGPDGEVAYEELTTYYKPSRQDLIAHLDRPQVCSLLKPRTPIENRTD